MKIKEIYGSQNRCYVSLAMALLCVVVTLITALWPESYTKLTYAFPISHPWQALSGVFVHGSPQLSTDGTIGHLGFNLLLVLPFGILLEKMVGSKRFLCFSLALWILNAMTFYLIAYFTTPAGEHAYGAGISGIAFSYGMVGLYTLYQLFKQDKRLALRQVSFYLLLNIALIMLLMINPVVAGVSSMIMHLVAVLAGIVFLIFRHQEIDLFLSKK